jgi:Skp family chaperone for outer membrane proteins
MNTFKKVMLGCAVVAPAAFLAGQASAQVNGIGFADPESVILGAKALDAANQTIATTYKAQLDQARTRQQALDTELQTLIAPIDTNKDKQLSEAEVQAAQAAKNPALAKLEAAQKAGQQEVSRLRQPATLAQAYAIEQIAIKYDAALKAVVTAKKVSLLLSAGAVQYNSPEADLTDEIKAELDRQTPTVPVTPPAGWQPSQQTGQLFQRYQQLVYYSAMQRQQQGAAAPAAGPAPKNAPAGR